MAFNRYRSKLRSPPPQTHPYSYSAEGWGLRPPTLLKRTLPPSAFPPPPPYGLGVGRDGTPTLPLGCRAREEKGGQRGRERGVGTGGGSNKSFST